MTRAPLLLLILLFASGCGTHFGPPLIAPVTPGWTSPVTLDGSPEGPLATDGKQLFATARNEGLFAIDLSTGKRGWGLEGGDGAVAARADLVVLRKPDGTVLGLSPEGKALWTTATELHGSLAPVLDGNRVFIGGEGLAALDAATGAVVWKEGDAVLTTVPVAGPGRVLFGEEGGTLRCRERESGRSLWTVSFAGPLLAAPTIDPGGRIYLAGSDRKFRALSLKDGSEHWSRHIGADVDTSPVPYGKTILLATQEGVLYCVAKRTGDIRWHAALPSRPLAAPYLLGSAVLVPCREHMLNSDVVAFDAKTGRKIHSFQVSAGENLYALLLGDRLYVGSRNPTAIACVRLNVTLGPQLPAPSGAPSRRTKPAL